MGIQTSLFDELIVDNFAGGGGASTGIELATGRQVDIAINHDPSAIAMHKRNHPYTEHYCESVWDADPRKITHGKRVALAWFSPDCKHFSKAKGGKPIDKKIRGLAWVAVKWAAAVKPRVIILENVEEFKTWGPVMDGKPVRKKAGHTFKSFVNALRAHGYTVDWRELKACDYGAPTIRKRFFLIARSDGKPIKWPEPTHGSPDSEAVKTGKLKPWRVAADIIDWSLPCPSVFDTADEIYKKHGTRAVRPLADATLRRIARGLQKFVFENSEPFIIQVNHTGERFRGQIASEPLQTVTAKLGYGVVTPYLMQCHARFGKDEYSSATEPAKTVLARTELALVAPTLIQYHGEQSTREVRGQTVSKPMLTADAANRYGLVTAFLSKYYGGGYEGAGATTAEPLPTITGIDHNALITSHLTIFRNHCDGQQLTEPFNTIMTSAGHFGEVRAFLVRQYGESATETVKINGEQYAIVDIGLRMLPPRELFNAQGFPTDYNIETGPNGDPISKAAQIARCGNAVPPPFAEALVRANLPEMCGRKIGTMEELDRAFVG
ncbi:MAG TPA: DNA (cytosine-5-)-methyltransferase [Ruminococcaceae bacterium]|nr:DNA (cytosine-5-)-methyltransferase [Oscillospiraceae bacterium]